jgi:hypothetical protein
MIFFASNRFPTFTTYHFATVIAHSQHIALPQL